MKPICFMIMPYGKKPTQAEAGQGITTIDFNALWDRAYAPVIKELGYNPVRADQDVGALIITQMIERLYFADLVLAEMTIPNGNVYYEVGVRHAARETGLRPARGRLVEAALRRRSNAHHPLSAWPMGTSARPRRKRFARLSSRRSRLWREVDRPSSNQSRDTRPTWMKPTRRP